MLTAFTAAETFGLTGWERDEVHVLISAGARVRPVAGLAVVVHRVREWRVAEVHPVGGRLRIASAIVAAAGTYASPRPACGILAAAVQQRLVRPDELRAAVTASSRVHHRRLLLATVEDIAMGAGALSEIDFIGLCRRYRIPLPTLQSVRRGPNGRRRYLDAEWRRRDGRRVAVEVDGAVHLLPMNWIDDQLRQNEITLTDTLVLQFPAVVVRSEPLIVAEQLALALGVARPS